MTMQVIVVIGVIAAVVSALVAIKALSQRAKPKIVNGEVAWPDYILENRLDCTVTVANEGPRACMIIGFDVKSQGFDIRMSRMLSAHQLPHCLRPYEREIFSFRSTIVPANGMSDVPSHLQPESTTVIVHIDLQRRPAIEKVLSRVGNTLKYK